MTIMYANRFGADPELFAVKKADGLAYSAHLLKDYQVIKGKAPSTNGNCDIAKDGFAFELHPSPTYCRDWAVPNMAHVMREFVHTYGYKLSAKTKMRLSATSLRNAPEDVMGYGCVPDQDAYALQEKTPPTTGYHDDYRYIGGHLHFSLMRTSRHPGTTYDTPDHHEVVSDEYAYLFAAAAAITLDIGLGVPLVSVIGHSNDYGEADRRRYYGQAGSFRHKPYGVEYRVPSSAIMLSPILFTYAIGLGRFMLQYLPDQIEPKVKWTQAKVGEYVEKLNEQFDFDTVRQIINAHDVEGARAFLDRHSDLYGKFSKSYVYAYNSPALSAFEPLMRKADEAGIGFNPDMMVNWQLSQEKFPILNHAYIGVDGAMKGKWGMGYKVEAWTGQYARPFVVKDDIFPQYNFQKTVAAWKF